MLPDAVDFCQVGAVQTETLDDGGFDGALAILTIEVAADFTFEFATLLLYWLGIELRMAFI